MPNLTTTAIIDVHAHYVASDLIDEAARNGQRYGVSVSELDNGLKQLSFTHSGDKLRPFLPELISLDMRQDYLSSNCIDVQVISTWTDMNGDELSREHGKAWARLQNETLAADAAASKGRFVAIGTVALQNIDDALEELDFLSRSLGIHGIELGSNINGRDLDHSEFRPLWRKLADLEVFVLLHPPFKPVGLDRVEKYFLNNLISYPVDTTIAAARLIFSGVMDEFPNLKICLAHGGGFLPYQIGRMDCGFAAHPLCSQHIATPPGSYLKSFYYDTLTHNDQALDFLNQVVGPTRLIYGSDYPFEMLDPEGPRRIQRSEISTEGQKLIFSENAQTLLRLA